MSEEIPKGEENLSNSQAHTQSPPTHSQPQAGSASGSGSGSSSGTTSTSQSSGTLSSVDTIPVTLASVPEEPEPQPWGRLLPMERGFRALNCVEESYLFGRDSKCDYVIGDPLLQSILIYSKRHFRMFREGDTVFVEDLSNNGTFVDGALVGKGKKHPLVNNSVLALAEERNRGACAARSTCKKVAVKIINKKNFPSVGTATRNAEREIEILRRIDHPCLIKTEDFYQTDDTYYIVLELMEGGELFNRVKSGNGLDEAVAKLYFYQMLTAVEVTDFNQSKILEEETLSRTLCGTPSYLAPEVFTRANTTGYGPAVDAWSLGVLLLGGYAPFYEHPSRPPIQEQIIQGVFTMFPAKWKGVSGQAKDMVRKLLDPAMLALANQVMYPPVDGDTDVSGNKRPREEEEEDRHPAKRKAH
ncbi:hypothetical protein CRUP_029716 [Coryphaenoides rupestris]|nr:hypothetical protein CRUP_029716 [Coryphaenoides rupestris]